MLPDRIRQRRAQLVARQYDQFAYSQAHAGRELLRMIPQRSYTAVLEPGCGTGQFTSMLAAAFPTALIAAFDQSPESVDTARARAGCGGVGFVVGDALDDRAGCYDLIAANAVFHWLGQPAAVIARSRRLLAPKGVLAFSVFGIATYSELKWACSSVFGVDAAELGPEMPDLSAWCDVLRREFQCPTLRAETFTIEYTSLADLLLTIRNTGVQGGGAKALPWTPHRFRQVEATYRREHGSIVATHDVLYCVATL